MRAMRVGQNHTFTVYIWFFGMGFFEYTAMYGVHLRFWPTQRVIEDMGTIVASVQ
jgi:hypothetical protein